ncbi:MAG: hypothetical protein D6B27_03920 [Gammaproteobacteria bacterium]|nr:MAG: hypothetical protein D6B27_03920 [Gammaproteobacteria bacterium]
MESQQTINHKGWIIPLILCVISLILLAILCLVIPMLIQITENYDWSLHGFSFFVSKSYRVFVLFPLGGVIIGSAAVMAELMKELQEYKKLLFATVIVYLLLSILFSVLLAVAIYIPLMEISAVI